MRTRTHAATRRILVAAMLVACLMTAGCTWPLMLDSAASFVAGWVANSLFGPKQILCYRNGQLVDCGSLPSDLPQ
jgi:hypothetical protein